MHEKTGNKKLLTCFAKFLHKNELNGYVALFITHESILSCIKSGRWRLRKVVARFTGPRY